MNEPADQIQAVNNPQQAIEQLVGEQFIEWLMDQIVRDLAAWPALRVLRDSQAQPEKLRRFLLQRELARQAFWGGRESEPGFLGFAVANLSESDDPDAEAGDGRAGTDAAGMGAIASHLGALLRQAYPDVVNRASESVPA